MMVLTRDRLDFAAIDAGRRCLDARDEDACKLVRDAVEVAQPLAVARKVTIEGEADGAIRARCDAERTLQVLSNLIGNA
jgi:signal transduction histidine kinase